jgi:hypothetical protein
LNKILMTAGVIVLIGIVVMAMGEAMYLATSSDYWNKAAYGTTDEWVTAGKQTDLFGFVFDLGMMIAGVGVAILAFGLALIEGRPQQFRQVETQVQLQQFPPKV